MKNQENKSRYTTLRYFKNEHGPIVVAELHATRPPVFFEGTDQKKAFCSLGAAGSDNLGELTKKYLPEIPDDFNGPWITVNAFGKTAEKLKMVQKGQSITVVGNLSYNEKNGYKNIIVNAIGFYAPGYLDFKEVNAIGATAPFVSTYESNSGDEMTNNMGMFKGKISKIGDLETKSCSYLRVYLETEENPAKIEALINHTYSKDVKYEKEGGRIQVTFFRKMAENMDRVLRVGMELLVVGSMEASEPNDDGSVYYNSIGDTVVITKWPPRAADKAEDKKPEAKKAEPKKATTAKKPAKKQDDTVAPTGDDFEDDDEENGDLPF